MMMFGQLMQAWFKLAAYVCEHLYQPKYALNEADFLGFNQSENFYSAAYSEMDSGDEQSKI